MERKARIEAYFLACSEGTAEDIARHFTDDAVIYDTNIRPMRTATEIGQTWVKVRKRWCGARWAVDSIVCNGTSAAIEWSMTGINPEDQRGFTFRGSEHYDFATEDNLIAEIRQYWTFDPSVLDTGLKDFTY